MTKRFLSSLLLAMVLTVLFTSFSSAQAAEYPQRHRIWWRPTWGYVQASQQPSGSAHEHRVEMAFKWLHTRNLQEVDVPRTPSQQGTYEHELRFPTGSSGETNWCEGERYSEVRDFPQDTYFDVFGRDPGEFAYGLQSWRLVSDHTYSVSFNCDSPAGTEHDSFQLSGQIGHCGEPPCNSLNTSSDDTNRLIPTKKGRVQDGQKDLDQSFTANATGGASFEDGTAPWDVYDGTMNRTCDSTVGYHKVCFLRVSSSGGQPSKLVYPHTFSPDGLGTSSVYSDAIVRCPVYWNGVSGCHGRPLDRSRRA